MSHDVLAVLREQEAASRAQRMSRQEKLILLKRAGWQNTDGNHWRSRDGVYASFATAVLAQLLAEREAS
jgi:hypothetical protein